MGNYYRNSDGVSLEGTVSSNGSTRHFEVIKLSNDACYSPSPHLLLQHHYSSLLRVLPRLWLQVEGKEGSTCSAKLTSVQLQRLYCYWFPGA